MANWESVLEKLGRKSLEVKKVGYHLSILINMIRWETKSRAAVVQMGHKSFPLRLDESKQSKKLKFTSSSISSCLLKLKKTLKKSWQLLVSV